MSGIYMALVRGETKLQKETYLKEASSGLDSLILSPLLKNFGGTIPLAALCVDVLL